jgi:PAS domain S-box-containing protein
MTSYGSCANAARFRLNEAYNYLTMEWIEHTADEMKKLKACINDLISVLALPAIWTGREPSHILSTLLDVLLGMLRLDFAYARLSSSIYGAPIEMVRLAHPSNLTAQPKEIGQMLNPWLTGDPTTLHLLVPNPIGKGEVSIASLRLGLEDEVGILVAGSQRADFPTITERLLLQVAANQTAIGLQEARLLSEQRRVAEELDHRVAERTTQLTAVNEELRKENIERKRAEQELRRSEAYLAEAQRLSHTGSFGWKSSGEIYWSEEMFQIFEYDRTTKPTLELLVERTHPKDKAIVKQVIERAQQDRKDLNCEQRLLMPDGSVKYLEVVAHAVEEEKKNNFEFVGAVMDITERRRVESELWRLQLEMSRVERLATLGKMTGAIAHELGTPLNSVLGYTQLLAGEDLPERTRRRVAVIETQIHRIIEVIQHYLSHSRGSAPRARIHINDLIRETLVLLQPGFQQHGMVVATALTESPPPLFGDDVSLQRVLINLINNAVDASAGNGRINIKTVVKAPGIMIEIADDGAGIPPEILPKIFDLFVTTKAAGKGTGLGLAISQEIIKAHGGTITISSQIGEGTTVQIFLPIDAKTGQSITDERV